MNETRTWRAEAATLIGRDHALVGRNGQDHAVAWAGARGAAVVVCDGCGEATGSELGARVTAVAAARVTSRVLEGGGALDDVVVAVGGEVRRVLREVACVVAGEGAAAFAAEHLAATLLVAAARGGEVIAFGWGDGLVRVDERVLVVDEGGRPRYLVGSLGADAVPPCSVRVRADGARVVGVATDGFDAPDLGAMPLVGAPALLRWMRVRSRAGAFRDDGAVGLLVGRGAAEVAS